MDTIKFVCVDCHEESEVQTMDIALKREKRCSYCYKVHLEKLNSNIRVDGLKRCKTKVSKEAINTHEFICVNCGFKTKPLAKPPCKCNSCFKKSFKKYKPLGGNTHVI